MDKHSDALRIRTVGEDDDRQSELSAAVTPAAMMTVNVIGRRDRFSLVVVLWP